jgi:hypothetical protein
MDAHNSTGEGDHGRRWIAGLIAGLALLTMGCGFFAALERRTAPTATASPTPSPLPSTPSPSATPTPEPTLAETPEDTPTPTDTSTPTADNTLPPTSTPTPTVELPTTTPTATETPESTAPPECDVLPEGPFLPLWEADPTRQAVLGCPTSNHPRIEPVAWEVSTSYQPFERGAMLWSDKIGWYEQPVIYVLYEDGTYSRYEDTYESGDDETVPETPPAGLFEPVLGFGKVWRENEAVRDGLGWATAAESPGPGRFQLYVGGEMLWLSQRGTAYVFVRETSTYDSAAAPSFTP